MTYFNTSHLYHIENLAFNNCVIAEIYLDNITVLPNNLGFMPNLIKVSCPNVVKTGSHTFSECSLLENISLPSLNITSHSIFDSCQSIKFVELGSLIPIGFPTINYTAKLILPDEQTARKYDLDDKVLNMRWHGFELDYTPEKHSSMPVWEIAVIAVSSVIFLAIAVVSTVLFVRSRYKKQTQRLHVLETKEALALSVLADFG